MNSPEPDAPDRQARRTGLVLAGAAVLFLGLGAAFVIEVWGRVPERAPWPLVDPKLIDPKPGRQSYADLVAAKEDLSDFDCYACHEKNKPPPIRFDANQKILLPKEHGDLRMAHGSHDRNNLCYNCHNETNLVTFQVRDGRELKFENSAPLCGSCHGPTFRDWEAGVHGRTSGHWDPRSGPAQRLTCVNCHNPHAPQIPGREPAPGPRSLHEIPAGKTPADKPNAH